MSVNYDLQVTTGGSIGATIEDIVAKVSSVIGLYPGYTYQRTEITGDVIHVYYSDDKASPVQAEFLPAVPAIVWAVLGVLGILGIAYISYSLVTVAEKSPTMIYAGLAVAGIFAVAYLIKSMKR